MGRKARKERESVASLHLGLRLTPELAAMLLTVVERANTVATANGLPPSVTASSLVRRWIEERLRAEMGTPDAAPMLKVGGERLEQGGPVANTPRKGLAAHMREITEMTGGKWRRPSAKKPKGAGE